MCRLLLGFPKSSLHFLHRGMCRLLLKGFAGMLRFDTPARYALYLNFNKS